jgi:AmiR/NasT family two-component response regulator
MKQCQLDEEAAYCAMRKMAMDRNLRMVELARNLIAASELFAPANTENRDTIRSRPNQ